MVVINITAVLAATIVQIVLGVLWYGPFFGKPWMKLAGLTPEKMKETKKRGMGKTYLMQFIASFLTAFVMAYFVSLLEPYGILEGVQLGFGVWLGFVVTTMLGPVLWLDKPVMLYAIDAGHYLVGLVTTGIILTLWR